MPTLQDPPIAPARPAPRLTFAGRTLVPLLDRTFPVRLRFAFPDGDIEVGRHSDAAAAGNAQPELVLRVRDAKFFDRIANEGSLGLAETYMDGGWKVERGSLEGFLTALLKARLLHAIHGSRGVLLRVALLRLRHALAGTQSNVRAHYDIGDDLYATFLDETRGYTCGYQRSAEDDIRTLQENKYDRVCKKLHLQPGNTLYDLGCGYGGLLIHAAKHFGARCYGITNSADHGAFAAQRTKALGISDRVTIHTGDFSEAQGTYDRVVSVGMFEHLLRREHETFFTTFKRLMAPGGYGLLHTLGCVSEKNTPDPFIQKYIFPGSAQNPLRTLVAGFERQRLPILDVENVAQHYFPTVVRWLEGYRRNRHTLDPRRYDERFQRMWEFYLCGCYAACLQSEGAVWQVVVTNEYCRRMPLHRVGKI